MQCVWEVHRDKADVTKYEDLVNLGKEYERFIIIFL